MIDECVYDENEIWKTVEGTNGKYEVSSYGKVKSNFTNKILLPATDKYGYLVVCLIYPGHIRKNMKVHRLVADAFVLKIPGKNIVNHINCNKQDNRYWNLEWCTVQENTKHAYDNGKIDIKKLADLCSKPLLMYDLDTGVVLKEFSSGVEAGAFINHEKPSTTSKTILKCANGKFRHAYGYKWKFK